MSDNRRNTRNGNVDPRRQQPKVSKKAMRKRKKKRKIVLLDLFIYRGYHKTIK